MKTKVLFFAGVAFMGFLLLSCEERLNISSKVIDGLPDNDDQTAQGKDNETMYMMQSNSELILADRIISTDGGFVLDISKEEASELQISAALYQRFVSKVNELNKQNVKK